MDINWTRICRWVEYWCCTRIILGQDNIDPTVLQIEVNAKPVAIISTETFTPRAQINELVINPY